MVGIPNLETRFAQLLPNLLNQIAVAPSIAEENTAKSLWHEGPITSVYLWQPAHKISGGGGRAPHIAIKTSRWSPGTERRYAVPRERSRVHQYVLIRASLFAPQPFTDVRVFGLRRIDPCNRTQKLGLLRRRCSGRRVFTDSWREQPLRPITGWILGNAAHGKICRDSATRTGRFLAARWPGSLSCSKTWTSPVPVATGERGNQKAPNLRKRDCTFEPALLKNFTKGTQKLPYYRASK